MSDGWRWICQLWTDGHSELYLTRLLTLSVFERKTGITYATTTIINNIGNSNNIVPEKRRVHVNFHVPKERKKNFSASLFSLHFMAHFLSKCFDRVWALCEGAEMLHFALFYASSFNDVKFTLFRSFLSTSMRSGRFMPRKCTKHLFCCKSQVVYSIGVCVCARMGLTVWNSA